nr:MAG TPA: hypothetical protein [Caudoviricetes sp.]
MLRVRHVLLVAALVAAILVLRGVGIIQPTPMCSTPYGAHDTATCVYGDYAYRHGVQV